MPRLERNRGLIFRSVFAAIALVVGFCHAQERSDPGAVPPAPPGRSSAPVAAVAPSELAAALKKGGFILYFRHTATDFSRNDAKSRGPTDCENQRPLTDRGRDDARAIAAAMKKIGVPVARALASPTCRTVETGKLIFGRAEPTMDVRGSAAGPQDPERYAALKRILATAPPAGRNLGIASHGNPFFGVAGPPYLTEGEMAVVRPLGTDFEVYARVRVDEWPALVAAAR